MIFGYDLIKPVSISISGASASGNITPNGSVEFTDCEIVNVENVFTLDYRNYCVFFSFYNNQNQNILLDMITTSGSLSNATVNGASLYAEGTSIFSNRPYSTVAQITYTGQIYANEISAVACGYMEFYGPRLSGRTSMRCISGTTKGTVSIYDTGVVFDANEAHTGFEISTEAALSGRITVCGIGG
jgi:hypothetical protein